MKNTKNIFAFMNAYSSGKSGADIALIELLKRLKNYEKTVITSKNGINLCNNLELKNISAIITSKEKDINNLLLIYIKRTWNIIFSKQIPKYNSILLSSSDFFPDVIPCFLLKGKNVWIQTIHHLYPHYKNRKGNIFINFLAYYLQRLSFFLIKKRANKIIVVNSLVKNQLIKLGFNKNIIKIIPNAIDISYYEKIKREKYIYDAVYLGRLNYSKGIFDLIDIWKHVIKKNKKFKLAIIGKGSKKFKDSLLKKANNNKLTNNIKYLGYLSDKQTFSIIKSSKLFINPSHEEGFSITCLQAIACNIPVISWNLKSYKKTFKNNLIKIQKGNIHTFSNSIIKLLKDKKQRNNISKKAFKYIRKYDWKYILPEYINILNNI